MADAPDWFGLFVRLANAGLGDFDRLGRFTERQLIGFDKALRKQRRLARADSIEDISVAVWDGKAARERIGTLRKG